MAEFSATDAALAGFRFVKERPRVLLVWAGAQLVFSLVFSALMVVFIGPQMNRLMAAQYGGAKPDMAQMQAMWAVLGPLYALMLPAMLAFYAILYALFSRAVLRPADDRFGYLRLGKEELRQGLLLLLAFVVGLGLEFVGVLAVLIVAVIGGVAASMAGWKIGAGLVTILPMVVLFCGVIFFATRLSLASPLTFDTGRVNLFGSWKLTRGRFWKLFGCYLLAGALAALVLLLTLIVGFALAAAVGGGIGALKSLIRPDMTSLAAFFSPARLAISLVGALGSALTWPVLMMPAPTIYKALTSES